MKFKIEELTVYFPYKCIYPEQYAYITEYKQALDADAHCLIEMATGTGKTMAILSLLASYMIAYPAKIAKVVYCSRTVAEVEKVMGELKSLADYIQTETSNKKHILGVCLSSRKNLCVHPEVTQLSDAVEIDSKCYTLTASFNREKEDVDEVGDIEDLEGDVRRNRCSFYEKFDKDLVRARQTDVSFEPGVYDFNELKSFSESRGWCPYFTARKMLTHANFIIYTYPYLLDPKISQIVSSDLPPNTVIVLDEAHNLDGTLMDAMSVNIDRNSIDNAQRALSRLTGLIDSVQQESVGRLEQEYQDLVERLARARDIEGDSLEQVLLANPVLPQHMVDQAIPGSIRFAPHFARLLARWIEYLRYKLKAVATTGGHTNTVGEVLTPAQLLRDIYDVVCIEKRQLRFCWDRLQSLLRSLKVTDLYSFSPLVVVASFGTLVATYQKGFCVLGESQPLPKLHLACLDATIGLKPILNKFQSVLVTSGTLSPLPMFPKLYGMGEHLLMSSIGVTLPRQCICPVIVTRGADQVPLSSQLEARSDNAVLRNYGLLVAELSRWVPDGMVAFMPSYLYLEKVVGAWYEQGIIDRVLRNKLVFIETPDPLETSVALTNYRAACDNGRGALLLSVARGKVSEGVDFAHHYGRCVVMIGVPYVYTASPLLRCRLDYVREQYGILEADWLTMDAMRQASQCLGRALRGKSDYGLLIMADKRYARSDKLTKLPTWIGQQVDPALANTSSDEAVRAAQRFFRLMGQPCLMEDQLGISLLTEEDVAVGSKLAQEHLQKLVVRPSEEA